MEASDVRAENGRVLFSGDENILARANICSRFSERVLVLLGSFEAHSFEELFQGTRALPWEQWIGADDAFPVKGYSITVNLLDEASRRAAPTVSLLDDETKLVTSRLGEDRFRVAGTAEFNGVNRDIRADRIRPLVDWVQQCFPGVSTRQVVPWAGLRPMMPDMMPKVGRGRQANVFYNTGHGHLGWTLSAATADLLGELVAGAAAPSGVRLPVTAAAA